MLKYSGLYTGILTKILGDQFDADECANDVLLALWNTIPPNHPRCLSAYVCKIAKYVATDKIRYNTRQKRNTDYTVMLSELEDCLTVEDCSWEVKETSKTIRMTLHKFLKDLDPVSEILFVRRYVYFESVAELSQRFEMDENLISVKLYRARKKLKKALEKEGIRV
jgi:RNA polymerase sigma-70 factor (ECF subfamily)